MKRLYSIPVLAICLAAIMATGCTKQINQLKARSELNKGVKAFSAGEFDRAAEQFEAAMELDPELTDARNYLAYANMQQYNMSGNEAKGQEAIAGFKQVLDEDPDNALAVGLLASMFFEKKDFAESEKWHRRRIEILERKASESEDGVVDPLAAESYYSIGVMKWTQSYEPRMKVRAELGMKPDDPGPIKDEEKRKEVAAETIPTIQEGLDALNNALKINPDYADAMAYLNLLNRERADFADSPEEYEEYMAKADDWVQKTLATKRRLAEESTTDQFAEGQ
jgi:tetratricopeptide (TPR) repeat protein